MYIQKDGNHQCSGRSIVSLFGTLIKLSSLIKTLNYENISTNLQSSMMIYSSNRPIASRLSRE